MVIKIRCSNTTMIMISLSLFNLDELLNKMSLGMERFNTSHKLFLQCSSKLLDKLL